MTPKPGDISGMSLEELYELRDTLALCAMYAPDPTVYDRAKEVRSRIRELEK